MGLAPALFHRLVWEAHDIADDMACDMNRRERVGPKLLSGFGRILDSEKVRLMLELGQLSSFGL